MILDFQEVAKIAQKRSNEPVLMLLPVVTSYPGIVHYQNQEIDIDTIQLICLKVITQTYLLFHALIF